MTLVLHRIDTDAVVAGDIDGCVAGHSVASPEALAGLEADAR